MTEPVPTRFIEVSTEGLKSFALTYLDEGATWSTEQKQGRLGPTVLMIGAQALQNAADGRKYTLLTETLGADGVTAWRFDHLTHDKLSHLVFFLQRPVEIGKLKPGDLPRNMPLPAGYGQPPFDAAQAHALADQRRVNSIFDKVLEEIRTRSESFGEYERTVESRNYDPPLTRHEMTALQKLFKARSFSIDSVRHKLTTEAFTVVW